MHKNIPIRGNKIKPKIGSDIKSLRMAYGIGDQNA